MPRADASGLRLAARALGAALVALAVIPGYLMLTPPWRALAIRLACVAIVVAVSVRTLRHVRSAVEDAPPWALDEAPAVLPPPELDERFVRLRDELVFSSRNRRYFEMALRPRLERLAGTELSPRPERRGRRGPARDSLERLVAEIERRP